MPKERVLSFSEPSKDGEIDVRYLLGVLIDSKGLLIAITLTGLLFAMGYVFFAPVIYQADVLIQLEDDNKKDIFDELYKFSQHGNVSSTSTEMTLIKSRKVLGSTVDSLALDTLVSKGRFPFFAKRFLQPTTQIKVPVFRIPDDIMGHVFTLTVIDSNHYHLEGGGIALDGQWDNEMYLKGVRIQVHNIGALPKDVFILEKISRFSAIENINHSLSVSESSKDSGVLRLTLLGQNKQLIRQTLNELSDNYIRQNIDRKSESASKSLIFLQQQLPKVKEKLEKTEADLRHYQQVNESIDLPQEARGILESEEAVTTQLGNLAFEEAVLSKLYTRAHPLYRALIEKKETLQENKASLDQKINSMPKTQQNILRLTRDVEVAEQLYSLLINKQQELEITKASTVGDVRIVDAAETLPGSIQPNRLKFLICITLFFLFIAVFIVLLKNNFKRVISDSHQLQLMGIKVYTSIPYSKIQACRKHFEHEQYLAEKLPLLALSSPDDSAVEAIRSLRTSLYFLLKQAKNKILMIVGPTSNMGKTFISCNLAVVFAQSGLKVLLVDCDMRKGYLHSFFSSAKKCGLSEVLSGQCRVNECLHHSGIVGLDFIARGNIPPNPSELLLTAAFAEFCHWASNHYDVVLFDTPPILAVSDAVIISHYSGANMMVTRFDVSTPQEVELAIQRFTLEGQPVTGVVLNAVHPRAAQYFQYGHLEHYRYKSDAAQP